MIRGFVKMLQGKYVHQLWQNTEQYYKKTLLMFRLINICLQMLQNSNYHNRGPWVYSHWSKR